MKVLVADKLEKSAIDGLGALGCEVVMNPDLAGDALAAAIGAENPAVVVVRSTVVDRAAIEASSSLKVIIRGGVTTRLT
jgi:phosphoglycerate dehydrogenase-like enzyme